MPIFGLGLHFLIALFFAVHAVRNGRNMYWLLILFSFPLLGSVVYLFAEYLPGSRINRGMSKAAGAAVGLLDPDRELREARNALELSPSAQNQLRLAKALLARGESHEAVQHFDNCLAGPLGKDPEIRFAAATAKLQDGQVQPALAMTRDLKASHPTFRAEQVTLLLAQAFAAAGDAPSAQATFAAAAQTYGSVEARAQYAIWAAGAGDLVAAQKMQEELMQAKKHWNAHSRALHQPLLRKVEEAINARKRS